MEFTVSQITDYRLLCDVFNRAMRDQGFSPLEGEEADALVLVPVMMRAAQLLEDAGGDPDLPRMRGDYSGVDPKALKLAERCIYKAAEDAIERLKSKFAERAILPQQDSIKPRTHYTPNSKLANSLDEPGLYEDGGTMLDITSAIERRKGKTVTEAVSISIEAEGVSINRKMTQFDSDVQSALATLWVAGNRCVTASQVCQTLTGSKKPTGKQIADVASSIDKMMRAWVDIDATQEARGRKMEFEGSQVDDMRLSGYMIAAEKVTIRTRNGKTTEGYSILRAPILYRHAAMLGQVVTFPQHMLETDDAGTNTKPRTLAKNYLARRIGQMQRGKVSNRVRLETVYKKAEVDPENRKARNELNKYVESLLTLWKASGFITGYRKVTEGPHKRFAAVDLAVPHK